VGTPQLRNSAIISSKLNRASIGGFVLAWAHVSANGHVRSGSRGAIVSYTGSQTSPPLYFVRWRGVGLNARCAPLATLGAAGSGQSGVTGIVTSVQNFQGRAPNRISVKATNAGGALVPADFYLAVIC
jgi:hypothetical protein